MAELLDISGRTRSILQDKSEYASLLEEAVNHDAVHEALHEVIRIALADKDGQGFDGRRARIWVRDLVSHLEVTAQDIALDEA